MKSSICFLNGRYLDTNDATVSALDRGFLFGEGLFETWRTYKGQPFGLREHLRRMAKSARALGIPFDPQEPWHARTRRLTRANDMAAGSAAVRLTITRGSGPVSLIPGRAGKPTRLMLVRPLDPKLPEARMRGVSIHLMRCGRGVQDEIRQIKSLNYLPAIIGKQRASAHGCFEAVYHLDDGTVLEGTTSNLFVVKRGTLVTTPVAEGLLPGITRAMVLALARRLGPVDERPLQIADLNSADEVFLTSSSIEVLPVTRIGRRAVAAGRVGELTQELERRYRKRVARSLGMPVGDLGD